jgi:hypothetical protein
MNSTALKVTGFLVVAAAVFGIAVGLGQLVGPAVDPAVAHPTSGAEARDAEARAARPATTLPGGVMTSQDGYTLQLTDAQVPAGRNVPVEFTIEGPDGRAVTDYAVEHEKRLHLIAVRRDFTGFQHLHPHLGSGGHWAARVNLTPGDWRLFADFRAVDGPPLTLGADLAVPGDYQPVPSGGTARVATVDGYTVVLDGHLTAGTDTRLTARVTKDGEPVTDLQPYLGAYGHLVALRKGDLAYLHVHPDGHPGDGTTRPGPDVVFYAGVPSEGTYQLYLDFRHRGVVRTAAFTLSATDDQAGRTAGRPRAGAGHSDEGNAHQGH